MSKNTKKKSTTKYKNFKMSPMVPIIAVIEIIILVCVSSYAWFVFSKNKTVGISQITVDADSGLDIDYKDADKNSFININEYIDDDFAFEPATSLDGKNIYFPTTGTFNNADTSKMIFRDGTVNDINSKYLSIDFELSNTADKKMEVYLSNNSTFTVFDNVGSANSAALRLALYQNDGSTGNVKSELISKTGQSTPSSDIHTKTVYFRNDSNWSDVYAYVWTTSGSGTQEYLKLWPGARMQKVCGKIYSYTFLDTEEKYNKVVFNNTQSGSGNQTNDLDLTSGNIYYLSDSTSSRGRAYNAQTVYFLKPNNWGDAYCHAWKSGGSKDDLTSWPGDKMTEVAAGVYSYTFSNEYNRVVFNDGSGGSESGFQTQDITCGDKKLYYINGNPSGTGCPCGNVDYSMKRVYFYNSLNWDVPYARVTNTLYSDFYKCIPMIALTGNVYYCDIPSIFCSGSNPRLRFSNSSDPDDKNNLTLESTIFEGFIYRPLDSTQTEEGKQRHELKSEAYDTAVGDGTYAVVSPGVSAGFQRSYNPVLTIDNESGKPSAIVPAFANSFDNYIYGSKNPLFSLESGETSQLSLIIWLEGTDIHCTGENYAGNNINLYLEFSTSIVNEGDQQNYKYRFVDATKEMWTSDRITNPITGVSVDPVMQLYDVDAKRGYLMSPASYSTYNDKIKVEVWECNAPKSLVMGTSENEPHHLMFRRVNPYNEDEVWNYWDAGTCTDSAGGIIDDAFTQSSMQGKLDTISFTAFADGSPTKVASGSVVLPNNSCGGLWGQYKTALLKVVDGFSEQWIKNDRGIITINYTYNYKDNNADPQTIEYKASVTNDIYSFIVPIEDNSVSISGLGNNKVYFRRYYDFDSNYAMNINDEKDGNKYNSGIKFAKQWDAGSPKGMYYQFSTDPYTSDEKNYWGSDIVYIQADGSIQGSFDDCYPRVHYYNTSNENTYYNCYLHKNNNFAPSGGGYGYVSVVPCDQNYNNYRIERVNKGNKDNVYNRTSTFSAKDLNADATWFPVDNISDMSRYQTSVNSTYVSSGIYKNTVNWNICSLRNFYKYYFLHLHKNLCDSSDPQVHSWKNGGSDTGWSNLSFVKMDGDWWKLWYFVANTSAYDNYQYHTVNYNKYTGNFSFSSDASNLVRKYSEYGGNLKDEGTWSYTDGFDSLDQIAYCLFNSPDWD